jgi:hypothetical protein
MFKDKYPLIHEISQLIKTNKDNAKQYIKNIINLEQITANDSNTIMINDYELTSKISHYKLNNDVPISTNSNTFCYQIGYANYIYYIMINMLHGINYGEVFSDGEFYIPSRTMIEIFVEVHNLILNLYHFNNLKDPIVLIKDVLDELINGDIEDEVYKFAQEDYCKNKLVIMNEDTLIEMKEDIIDTFRNYNKSNNDNPSGSGAVESNQNKEGTPPVSAAESDAEESEDEKETELEKIVKEDEKILPLIEKIESTLSMNEKLEQKFGIIDESENNNFYSDTEDDDDETKVEPDINTNKDILVSAN